jgi:hypothetical protein
MPAYVSGLNSGYQATGIRAERLKNPSRRNGGQHDLCHDRAFEAMCQWPMVAPVSLNGAGCAAAVPSPSVAASNKALNRRVFTHASLLELYFRCCVNTQPLSKYHRAIDPGKIVIAVAVEDSVLSLNRRKRVLPDSMMSPQHRLNDAIDLQRRTTASSARH